MKLYKKTYSKAPGRKKKTAPLQSADEGGERPRNRNKIVREGEGHNKTSYPVELSLSLSNWLKV